MKRVITIAGLFLLVVGCRSGGARTGLETERDHLGFGPPPPGYIKIRGEAVPGWEPWHMFAAPRGAGRALLWQPLGPRPILDEFWSGTDDASGRVVSIAVHPVDPNTAYIASASGGVWKTTDGGGLWTPLTDELSNLNHGCVAIDPSNPSTIYAGTGEYTLQSTGDGIFRSTDGGTTWQRIGTTGQVGSTCSRIIVDPTNPQVIHLTGNSGYVRSTDGGATWLALLPGLASDLALNPTDPSRVYVGRHGDGVYRSLDGGNSFVKLAGGLPSSGFDRIILALAASNPNVVYTGLMSGGSLLGLYKTTDGGNVWTHLANTPDFPSPQAWYDACLAVDPADPNTVYAGGVFPSYAVAGVIRSTDGGASWTDITYGLTAQLHPDQHALAFGPDGTLWVGNDGGVWKKPPGSADWINTNATLTVTQNYNIALHPTDVARVIGGTQDNGSVERQTAIEDWPQILSGDGGFCAYDFTDPRRKYTTYVYLNVYRFNIDGSVDWISGPWGNDPVNFIAPLVMDPNDPNTLLGGTDRVWRTTNAATAATWTPISDNTVGAGGRLNAIAVARTDSNVIYTGSSTGKVYRTLNASTWSDLSTGLPAGQISDICVSPGDFDVAYVAFHNTSGPRVLRKDTGAATWTDVTGDLPAGVSARAMVVDWRFSPPGLYIGSGVGVYSSSDGGASWIKDGLDLPNVNIGDLAIHPVDNTLIAGTYGRGAWRADLPAPCNLPGDANQDGLVDGNDVACFTDCRLGGAGGPPCNCDCAYPAQTTADAINLFVAALIAGP